MATTRDIYSLARAQWIIQNAPIYGLRTGQLLFNNLPVYVANAVRGTLFDPFYKELREPEIVDWFNDHVIFSDNDEIILVYDNNTILWERE